MIVGVSPTRLAYSGAIYDDAVKLDAPNINPYLAAAPTIYINPRSSPLSALPSMTTGNMPRDGGNLILSLKQAEEMRGHSPESARFLKRYVGAEEMINGKTKFCLWIEEQDRMLAESIPQIEQRAKAVAEFRSASPLASTRTASRQALSFVFRPGSGQRFTIVVAITSSENRDYLPVAIVNANSIASNLLLILSDAPLWNMALIASRIHLVWIAAVCGKMKTDFRYSNTLGWNTFPVPTLTEQNKANLTRCAEDILLAREAHFPATIADLYRPETDEWKMPANLRAAHDANDETLERIYIGRHFRNDTERLEKLFEMYVKTQGSASKAQRPAKKTRVSRKTAEVGK